MVFKFLAFKRETMIKIDNVKQIVLNKLFEVDRLPCLKKQTNK